MTTIAFQGVPISVNFYVYLDIPKSLANEYQSLVNIRGFDSTCLEGEAPLLVGSDSDIRDAVIYDFQPPSLDPFWTRTLVSAWTLEEYSPGGVEVHHARLPVFGTFGSLPSTI